MKRRFGSSQLNDGDLLDGRYRIEHQIDAGGAGAVLKGVDERLGRNVAIKVLHTNVASQPGYQERFQREARVATRFDHGNIVRLYDFGTTDNDELFLVMELLEGRSLKEVIRDDGPLSTHRAMNITIQVLDGLSHAHAQDIVHRDLKPGNIFVTSNHRGDDIAKILDFGLAKSLSSHETGRLTQTGAICGTAKYIAPELLVVQKSAKPGDIYAVGLILLEMLLKRPVFGSESMAQTFAQHLVAPVRIPDSIWNTPLGKVIVDSTRKHPDDRFSDADSMYHALKEAMFQTPDFAIPGGEIPGDFESSFSTRILYELTDDKNVTLDILRNSVSAESYTPAEVNSITDRPTVLMSMFDPGDDTPTISDTPIANFKTEPDGPPKVVIAVAIVIVALVSFGVYAMTKGDTKQEPSIAVEPSQQTITTATVSPASDLKSIETATTTTEADRAEMVDDSVDEAPSEPIVEVDESHSKTEADTTTKRTQKSVPKKTSKSDTKKTSGKRKLPGSDSKTSKVSETKPARTPSKPIDAKVKLDKTPEKKDDMDDAVKKYLP